MMRSQLSPVAQVSAGWLRNPVTCCGGGVWSGLGHPWCGYTRLWSGPPIEAEFPGKGRGPVHRLRLSFLAALKRRRGNAGCGPSAAGARTIAVGGAEAVIGPAPTILCRG
ncbi:hypothetical protein GCM10023335_75130 [Streptomyces siamensis]|uniref:Uncharacterized protein n=1 Tax=Streptomyces siamensis TaxID=1274986 RepID=A0ABP9JHP5_9ACTN